MAKRGVIIVAGGTGSRMGNDIPKQFLPLGPVGKPILAHTLERFAAALPDAQIVVALPSNEILTWERIVADYGITARHTVCIGGPNRFGSVKNAIGELDGCDIVAIHDGVRPLVSADLIAHAFTVAEQCGTAIPADEPVDSFRMTCGGDYVDGESIWVKECPIDRNNADEVAVRAMYRAGKDCVAGNHSNGNSIKEGTLTADDPAGMDRSGAGRTVGYRQATVPLDRSRLLAVQTPQVFKFDLIAEAYQASYDKHFTDDASVAESAGAVITICSGERTNIKITTPDDIMIAEALLAAGY